MVLMGRYLRVMYRQGLAPDWMLDFIHLKPSQPLHLHGRSLSPVSVHLLCCDFVAGRFQGWNLKLPTNPVAPVIGVFIASSTSMYRVAS